MRFSPILLGFLLLGVALPVPAAAQSIGDMMCRFAENSGTLPLLMSAISYLAGLYFAVQGGIDLQRYTNSPAQNKLHPGVVKLATAGALVSLPGAASIAVETLMGSTLGSTPACTVAALTTGTGLDGGFARFIGNIFDPGVFLVSAVGYILGLLFVMRGLFKASRFNTDPGKNGLTPIVANLLIGALLIALGQNAGSWLGSLFGSTAVADFSALSGATVVTVPTGAMSAAGALGYNSVIEHVLMFVQLIGLIGFVRGWVMIKHAVEGQGQQTVGQGLTHVIGGIIAVNIFSFLNIADQTFGLGI